MKRIVAVLVMLILSAQLSAEILRFNTDDTCPFVIEQESENSVIVAVTLGAVTMSKTTVRGTEYQSVGIEGFGKLRNRGAPSLPFRALNVIGDRKDISVTVLYEESVLLDGYAIYPSPGPVHPYSDLRNAFNLDETVYTADTYYPERVAGVGTTLRYKGVPVTQIHIQPVQCNPVQKKIRIVTRLQIQIDYSQSVQTQCSRLNVAGVRFLKNCALNSNVLPAVPRSSIEDFEDDVLILTHDSYKAAAEKLAEWQRMKGYDVHIESKASWDSVTIKNTAHALYNDATVKPGYLLIFGNMEQMPSPIGNYVNFKPYPMDVYYASPEGADHIPEMARGRIVADSESEANTIVAKIIQYEKEPPASSDYYNTILASAFFQTAGDEGYEELGFTRTVENVRGYLDSIGYSVKRAYCAPDGKNPMYWNNTCFGFGNEIPAELKRPGFAWNADENTISSIINEGCFLAYHYDHGLIDGWVDPNFRIADMKSLLSNSGKLPIIYSMDCVVGRFNEQEPCFAEEVVKKAGGGAVGIIAAACVSYTGNNEGFLHGLIDATWPGTVLKVPQFQNPEVSNHEPVYIIGDIMDQGLFRMGEFWPDTAKNAEGFMWTGMTKFHYDIYHYFGDPTTRIWTAEPKTVSVKHVNGIPSNAKNYALSNMNITSSVATLYDNKTGVVVGKKEITGSSASIKVVNPISSSGNVTLTITGQNIRPYIKELPVGPTEISNTVADNLNRLIQFKNNTLYVSHPGTEPVRIVVNDVRGRTVKEVVLSGGVVRKETAAVNLNDLSNGFYVIQCLIGKEVVQKEICLLR